MFGSCFRKFSWASALLVGLIFCALLLCTLWWQSPDEMLPPNLTIPGTPSVEIQDRNGETLRLFLAEEKNYRQPVALSEVSPYFWKAMIAAEDMRFWEHGGVDVRALLRAASEALRAGRFVSGASTISQQVAKLSLAEQDWKTHTAFPQLPPERTLHRKWQEVRLARTLETRWPKEAILQEYINRLEFGHQQQGIRAAAWYFFGKPPSQLSLAESALLAALPNAPSRLSPHRHPQRAQTRQRLILDRLLEAGWISSEEHARAWVEPWKLRSPEVMRQADAFVDLVWARSGVASLASRRDGRLTTTLDAALTRWVTKTLTEQLSALRSKNVGQGAVVILHNPTGEVLAVATVGRDEHGNPSTINGAWSPRSAGSALKPFAYLLALEQGAFPGTIVPDVPASFATPTGVYRPNNFNGRFYGPVTLREALGNSLNLAAIHTLQSIGGPPALHRFLRQLGLTTLEHPPEHYGLGLVLGNAETRLLEIANAYATIARLGMYRPLRYLRYGPASLTPEERVFSAESAWLLADMLSDNAARTASFGIDSALRFPFPVAVKTGTSSNYRDNVAVGFTQDFTVAVWVGNGDGSPMREITGVTGAGPVLQSVFQHLHRERGTTWMKRPQKVQSVTIHGLNGKVLEIAQATERQRVELRTEWAANPVAPSMASDFDAEGRILLGREYAAWWNNGRNPLVGRAVLDDASSNQSPPSALSIVHPPPGTKIFLDPDMPLHFQRLRPQASGGKSIRWFSPSLDASQEEGFFTLKTGRHEIWAHDSTTGENARTWIEVEAF